MAELVCCRFSELVKLKVEISDVYSGSRKLTSFGNPRKVPLLGTSLRLASPSPVFPCDYNDLASLCRNDNTSVEMRQRALAHGNGSDSWNGKAEVQDAGSSHSHAEASLQTLASISPLETGQNENSRDAMSTHTPGHANGINDRQDVQSITTTGEGGEILVSDIQTGQIQDAFLKNKMHPMRASCQSDDKAHNAHELDVTKSDDSHEGPRQSRFVHPIFSLLSDETMGDGISSVAPLRVSEVRSILQQLKLLSKIEELFYWIKTNCPKLDVHSLVFEELGKRKEWSILDSLVRNEVKLSQGEALCEVFNKLFQVCVTQDAPTRASKWFSFMIQEGIKPDSITFRLLMPLFRRHEMFEDADFAYQQMVGVGVECFITSAAMMFLYIRAGQVKGAKEVYFKMQEATEEPVESFLISELNSYVRFGNVKQAEELVKFMQECGVRLNLYIYNLMITVNGKAGEYFRAKEWFLCINKDGLHPNEATYRSIIGACGRAGNLYDALQFYDRMVALNFSPSLVNYNTLIHLHRKVDHEGRILALLLDMKLACCLPNSATFNSVLKVYERYGRLEKLPEALQLLTEAGWEPDEICFGLLIRAYVRCNMVDSAMEVFSKLCASANPEEIMCHNLICMCKSVGRYDEAIYVFLEMCRLKNRAPSLRTSCAVIDAYSLKGAIKEGEALFKKMRSEQELDAAVYNVVLNMYLKAGMLDKAAEVLREVLQEKVLEPDLYLFLCMLKVCIKCGLEEEALELYWRIVKRRMVWTEPLYTAVIHCCGRLLPLEEVSNVFDAMMSTKAPINTVTCNLLLDIFGKAGLLEKAERVLKTARKQGVQNCITFSTIIDAYGRKKKFHEMESTLIEMLNEGFKECVEAYNAMLDAYGNSDQLRKMETTFERMQMAGCVPDITTFNILLKVYGQEGLFEDLQSVLGKIKRAGLKPNGHSYTSLIHAYGSRNRLDEALEYFHKMQKAGFEPDSVTYTCVMSVLRVGGCGKEAARLSDWIKAEALM